MRLGFSATLLVSSMYEITTRINQLLGRGMLAAREIEVGIAREEIDKGS